MLRIAIAVAILFAACSHAALAAKEVGLAPEATQALAHPERVTIYSLEPMITNAPPDHRLDGFTVLGDAPLDGAEVSEAIKAFRDAMVHPMTMPDAHGHSVVVIAACFDPRHAISVQSNGHRFDFLLCYACGSLEVFRDGKLISGVAAGGSPASLNSLLKTKGLPLSKSGGTA